MHNEFDLIMAELKRSSRDISDIEGDLKVINDKLTDVRIEIASLKTSSRIWGAIAGFIPGVIIAIITFWTSKTS